MFTLLLFIFAGFGLAAIGFFCWVMFGAQSSTLFSKNYKFLMWKMDVESTKGKALNINIERQ